LATRLPLTFFFGVSPICRPKYPSQYAILYSAIASDKYALLLRTSHTRWQTLLQLLSAVRVLEDEGVEAALASDLELDLVGLLVLLYPRRCGTLLALLGSSGAIGLHIQDASFRRAISMNCLMSETCCGILAIVVMQVMRDSYFVVNSRFCAVAKICS
jgi:hypothetical protein